ncbi:MAG TPA: HepT-like ribonuclease domain-containing protein [Saprospiraceae bacterium]|nr:HepT-like ribonuclease domain-containing protein [Saprospiraceae bacterium]
MTERAKKYLSDILIAIDLIESFMKDITGFNEYSGDAKTKSAVERQLGIIGEAVNKYRNEQDAFELSHTKAIIQFRNRLVHSYDSVDDSIIWAIVRLHLPPLKVEVQKYLED